LKGGAATLPNDSFGIKSVLVKKPNGEIVEFPYEANSKELVAKIKATISGKSQPLQEGGATGISSKLPVKTGEGKLLTERPTLPEPGENKTLQTGKIGVQSTPSEGKIIDKTQLAKPSDLNNGDVSKFYNVDRMEISNGAKRAINKEIADTGKQLEETVGKTLTHKEIVDQANMTSKTLNRVVGRDETAKAVAANLNLRRKIAQVAESGKIDQEFVDLWLKDKAMGENIARQLEARKIIAKPEDADHINIILDSIYKKNKDADAILKEAKKVDFNDTKQVIEFYRKFVKPSAGEWLDKLRYNSMLSSPNTHLVNTASNWEGTGIIAPIEKTITGTLDAMRSALTGSERKYYTKEGIEYAKGYYSNIGRGAKKFISVMRGEVLSGNPDVRNIPLSTKGTKKVVERILDYPTRLLEGMDQFFTAMTSGGVEKSAHVKKYTINDPIIPSKKRKA
jgi:hypothetical protein